MLLKYVELLWFTLPGGLCKSIPKKGRIWSKEELKEVIDLSDRVSGSLFRSDREWGCGKDQSVQSCCFRTGKARRRHLIEPLQGKMSARMEEWHKLSKQYLELIKGVTWCSSEAWAMNNYVGLEPFFKGTDNSSVLAVKDYLFIFIPASQCYLPSRGSTTWPLLCCW